MWLAAAATAAVIVIAHRGDHTTHPENSLPAFEAAIAAGSACIEVDVRTSRDGRFFVIHDSTVHRTTNATGKVRELAATRLAALGVVEFAAVLRLARNRATIYVDVKDAEPAALTAEIRRAGMARQVLVFDTTSALIEWRRIAPEIPRMGKGSDLERALRDAAPLAAVGFNAANWTAERARLAKQNGSKVFLNRLGPYDTEQHWQQALALGVDGIETDRPAALAAWLKQRNALLNAPPPEPAADRPR